MKPGRWRGMRKRNGEVLGNRKESSLPPCVPLGWAHTDGRGLGRAWAGQRSWSTMGKLLAMGR